MIVHIFLVPHSVYTYRFIKMVKDDLDISEHEFLFLGKDDYPGSLGTRWAKDKEFKSIRERIQFIDSTKKIGGLIKKLRSATKIILHGTVYLFPIIFPASALLFWPYYIKFLKKCNWVIWGIDLYFYKFKAPGLAMELKDKIRKMIIRRIPEISCQVIGDYEIAKKVYGTKAKRFYVFYPNPVENVQLDNAQARPRLWNGPVIQVGNSGDRLNNHMDALDSLAHLKGRDIKVICPLSYGGDKKYVDKVVAKGKAIFGDDFIPLLEFMSPSEYAGVLRSVEVSIMNHKNQQGLGNILALLYLGKKVYIRGDTTSFKYFKGIGIDVFDTLKFKNETFEGLFRMDEGQRRKNIELIRKEFSDEHCVKLWKKIMK